MKSKSKKSEKFTSFIKLLIENWPAKVVCFLLAVLLYMICKIITLDKKSYAVPLEVRSAGTLLCTNSIPKSVRVTVRGEPNEIGFLQEKDFSVFIDITDFTEEGTYKVPVLIELSDNATMVEPLEVSVSPENIVVELDRKITDLKPIKVNTAGACAKGYEISGFEIEPDFVQVSGNSRQVNGMKYLETNAIDVTGKKDTFSQTIGVLNHNNMLTVTGNTEFNATVIITPIIESRLYKYSELNYSGLNSKYVIENKDQGVEVLLKAYQNDLDAFEATGSKLVIDCSDIRGPGDYSIPVIYSVPSNIIIESIEPKKLQLHVVEVNGTSKENQVEESVKHEEIEVPENKISENGVENERKAE